MKNTSKDHKDIHNRRKDPEAKNFRSKKGNLEIFKKICGYCQQERPDQSEAETNARPPLKDPLPSVAQYDKIILCYPICWHTAPMTVGTFLESYDLTGKYIYPISQSASMDVSQYRQSVAFIKECAKKCDR